MDYTERNLERKGIIYHLKNVCRILRECSINYVIVGGIAAILLGVDRITIDIDIIVHVADSDEVKVIVECLKRGGYKIDLYEALEAFKDKTHFTILLESGRMIDFKYAESTLDFNTLKRKMIIKIDEEEIPISPLEELIAAKLVVLGSQKDVEDALQLMYIYVDKIDWGLLESYVGEKPLSYANKILSIILREFKDDQATINKIKELELLKGKIEEALNKTEKRVNST